MAGILPQFICLVLMELNYMILNELNKARVDICYQVLATGTIIYERESIITADFVLTLIIMPAS
jgi:hypothetical protein